MLQLSGLHGPNNVKGKNHGGKMEQKIASHNGMEAKKTREKWGDKEIGFAIGSANTNEKAHRIQAAFEQ